MKRTWKLVRLSYFIRGSLILLAELEALGDDLGMEADEMPSYLQESAGGSQLPDFVDEAPVDSDVGAD